MVVPTRRILWLLPAGLLLGIALRLYVVTRPLASASFAFECGFDICVADIHGRGRKRLVKGNNPAWSPDGEQIAYDYEIFERNQSTGALHNDWSIYLVDVYDDPQPKRLTDDLGFDEAPDWSPDGNKIVFRSNRDGWELYVIDVEGTNLTRLTTLPSSEEAAPAWSPDGQKIAFASRSLGGRWDVYVMDADGGNITPLTETKYNISDTNPAWSPDGEQIAFQSDRDGNWEIYVMNADGSNQTRLTAHEYADMYPTWSPDGEQIAFLSGRTGRSGRSGSFIHQLLDIYVMDADGNNVRRITNPPSFYSAQELAWSPQS